MNSAPLAFVSAGGTGGHVYPALAIAEVLRDRGYRLRWVGTARGLEDRVVPAAGFPLHRLPSRGLRGKGFTQRLVALGALSVALLWAIALMLRYRPVCVIGLGGYASVPTAVAAWLTGRTLALQEQNAIAGSANRFLARFAQLIGTGFPGVFADQDKAQFLGNPVRPAISAVAQSRAWSNPEGRPLRVLILGGSLGALPLNELLPRIARELGDGYEWHHQCGPRHEDVVVAKCRNQANYRVSAYLEDMAEAYGWADLVVCRSGALTVAELAACGRPSILIPLPHAIDDHQTANARFLAEAEAAVLMPQARMYDELGPLLRTLGQDMARLAHMAAAAVSCARPNAQIDFVNAVEAQLQ